METILNFGGFYDSYYSEAIDTYIYDEDSTIDPDIVNFKEVYNSVAKHIFNQFVKFLEDEYGVDLKLTYLRLNSPRFYNYKTDTISLELSEEDAKKLISLVISDSDIKNTLIEKIKEKTTPVSGYIPFYDFNEVCARIDGEHASAYFQCLFDVLISMEYETYLNSTLELINEAI